MMFMRPAVVPFLFMMRAFCIRIVGKGACQKFFGARIRIARNARINGDARLFERSDRAAADTAAQERLHAPRLQKSRQGTVPRAVRRAGLRLYDFTALRIVYPELFTVAEMLKNFALFVGYCNFHDLILPFIIDIILPLQKEIVNKSAR